MPELTTLDLVLPFAVLLLPLAGFIVLALFGDWIKKDKEESGACWLACGTVLVAFGLAALSCLRASTACSPARRVCASRSRTWASSGSRPAASACRSAC